MTYMTRVTLLDDQGNPDLEDILLCGRHFFPRWKRKEIEIMETEVEAPEEDCDDCHMERTLRNFLNE